MANYATDLMPLEVKGFRLVSTSEGIKGGYSSRYWVKDWDTPKENVVDGKSEWAIDYQHTPDTDGHWFTALWYGTPIAAARTLVGAIQEIDVIVMHGGGFY